MLKQKLICTMEYAEFHEEFIKYWNNMATCRLNIAEGAMRAGKTVINAMAFGKRLLTHKGTLFLASGYSIANAKTVIGDCGGYGLEHLFDGRCRWGNYKNNEALFIRTDNGTKIVLFVGAGDSSAYKKIQGLSLEMWIATELPNHFMSTTEPEKDFVQMALSRLGASKDRHVFWDLNPVYPSHMVYTEYIDKYIEQDKQGKYPGGVNFAKFTLFHNLSLSDEQRALILADYTEGSVGYSRNILGERKVASGIIFEQFGNNPEHWLVDLDFFRTHKVKCINIGIDFGGVKSHTAFVASAIYGNFDGVCIIADDILEMKKGEVDSLTLREAFKKFYKKVIDLNLGRVQFVFPDCAEQVLITEIRNALKEMGVYTVKVYDSIKNRIKDRVDCQDILLNSDRMFILDSCPYVIKSLKDQVWDTKPGKEDTRLDNGANVSIDIADANEYSWELYIKNLLKKAS